MEIDLRVYIVHMKYIFNENLLGPLLITLALYLTDLKKNRLCGTHMFFCLSYIYYLAMPFPISFLMTMIAH